MGKIKKIIGTDLVGGSQSEDIYPVTSIKAVYDTSNERLDKILTRRSLVNISTNYNSDHIAEVFTLEQAINKVPSSDRVLGFQGKFLSEAGWKTYIFRGESVSNWNDKSKWSRFIEEDEFNQQKADTDKKISKVGSTDFSAELVTNTHCDYGYIYNTYKIKISNINNLATIDNNVIAVQTSKGDSIVGNYLLKLVDGSELDFTGQDIDTIRLYSPSYRVLEGGHLSFTINYNLSLTVESNTENIKSLNSSLNKKDREVKSIQSNMDSIADYSFEIDGYEGDITKHTNSAISSTGEIVSGAAESNKVFEFNIAGYNFVKVWGRSPGSPSNALASAVDSTGEVLQVYRINQGITYSNGIVLIMPESAATLRVFNDTFDPKIAVDSVNLKSDIISVNAEFPDDNYSSKEEARLKIVGPRRKIGLIITYKIVVENQTISISEKYLSTDYSDDSFSNSENWSTLLTQEDIYIKSEGEDISDNGISGENYVLHNQEIGSEIQFGTFGKHKKYTIPANTRVKISMITGGSYGFALVDEENKVLEYTTNSAGGLIYTFSSQPYTSFLYTSLDKIEKVNLVTEEILTDTVSKLKTDVEDIQGKVLTTETKIGEELVPSQTYLGNTLSVNGNTVENSGFNVYEYTVSPNTMIAITGRSPGNAAYVTAAAFQGSKLLQTYFVGTGVDYKDEVIIMPDEADKLRINTATSQKEPAAKNVVTLLEKTFYTKEEVDNLVENSGNYWGGKSIWWCGTSIPAGSDATLGSEETIAGNYPTQVGNNLNATVIDKAVGGSMCRANVRTGDYNGANFTNITSCLSMTKEEIENFITNYDSIKSKLTGGAPDSLNQSYLNRLREASFEDRLLPYLNGTYPMPDLFVLDHGHNDFKYKLSNGQSDIGLEPTIENISSGELAEDSYMTASDNAKLESFFGSLANIPSAQKEAFIASLNRNCYIGAMNFIITLILRYNPHARIIFISNYEYENGIGPSYAPLIPAQEELSKSWALPLCRVWQYLGYSNHIIPSSKDWFNSTYPSATPATSDITCFRAYNPDSAHPHSDVTGDANAIYAGVISEFIKSCR